MKEKNNIQEILAQLKQANEEIKMELRPVCLEHCNMVIVGNDFEYCIVDEGKGFATVQVIAFNNKPTQFSASYIPKFLQKFKAENGNGPILFKPMQANDFYKSLYEKNEKLIKWLEGLV